MLLPGKMVEESLLLDVSASNEVVWIPQSCRWTIDRQATMHRQNDIIGPRSSFQSSTHARGSHIAIPPAASLRASFNTL